MVGPIDVIRKDADRLHTGVNCVTSSFDLERDVSQKPLVRLIWNEKDANQVNHVTVPFDPTQNLGLDFSRSKFEIILSQEWEGGSICTTGTWVNHTWRWPLLNHYSDVIMSLMASQITGVSIVCSTVGSGAGQRKQKSPASLAFVRGIHRWLVNHKRPIAHKMFPFDDVIMPWSGGWMYGIMTSTNPHVTKYQ